jgi:hypothetical protein
MIWEVDDDVDGCIDWDEFRGAYARCVADKQCTEPSQLFHLIQFLLSDAEGGATVSGAIDRYGCTRGRTIIANILDS